MSLWQLEKQQINNEVIENFWNLFTMLPNISEQLEQMIGHINKDDSGNASLRPLVALPENYSDNPPPESVRINGKIKQLHYINQNPFFAGPSGIPGLNRTSNNIFITPSPLAVTQHTYESVSSIYEPHLSELTDRYETHLTELTNHLRKLTDQYEKHLRRLIDIAAMGTEKVTTNDNSNPMALEILKQFYDEVESMRRKKIVTDDLTTARITTKSDPSNEAWGILCENHLKKVINRVAKMSQAKRITVIMIQDFSNQNMEWCRRNCTEMKLDGQAMKGWTLNNSIEFGVHAPVDIYYLNAAKDYMELTQADINFLLELKQNLDKDCPIIIHDDEGIDLAPKLAFAFHIMCDFRFCFDQINYPYITGELYKRYNKLRDDHSPYTLLKEKDLQQALYLALALKMAEMDMEQSIKRDIDKFLSEHSKDKDFAHLSSLIRALLTEIAQKKISERAQYITDAMINHTELTLHHKFNIILETLGIKPRQQVLLENLKRFYELRTLVEQKLPEVFNSQASQNIYEGNEYQVENNNGMTHPSIITIDKSRSSSFSSSDNDETTEQDQKTNGQASYDQTYESDEEPLASNKDITDTLSLQPTSNNNNQPTQESESSNAEAIITSLLETTVAKIIDEEITEELGEQENSNSNNHPNGTAIEQDEEISEAEDEETRGTEDRDIERQFSNLTFKTSAFFKPAENSTDGPSNDEEQNSDQTIEAEIQNSQM